MLLCDFDERAGLYRRTIPVRVIDLKLHELRIRMLGQDLIQQLRPGVERESPVADFAGRFHFLHEIPQPILIVNFVIIILDRMEQVVVKIACAGALKADLQLLLRILFGRMSEESVELGRKGKTVPWITLDQRLAGCDL